ncbi:glycine/D-amino acid oxidase-like deaminating enzyme [Bradyrhizobium japonicum]|uniref:FAD-dependent oxidoreductase n=1 Tax=Bradyrhizobium japonicum TaxID=375 RepID=UPI0020A21B26|nr:FAD-dependent oxidoreductase [Bradyrhizobium japonicum]MCP1767190.1 glycine/D-amino acid oxidase-like deaminating enzyme [Bradyrhizobium japonicum]MCP1789329.1 glycine/D-amino acid oxidase-like deaminating enzyme [Bradyrhizobium japonicum]MCP1801828.1 glycine/D-amino acid oxidase-like deaminating enzyme [Bradyrhizobium japonicum]MCP1820139.1 glycine/D-amino acid oxidase-like deaminating enzyme [Bradyrhizobium japonicum]MCP1868353.1 glycine/D-amino acid oxidase-like deaminating enzyme [Brady
MGLSLPRLDLRAQWPADQCAGRFGLATSSKISLREELTSPVFGSFSIFKDEDIEQDDLRSARTPWAVLPPPSIEPITDSFRCEVLVVGAGITGALVAERLSRQGRQVVIIDREVPSLGSTVASTAMLLWEIDRPLFQLTELYGFEKAVRCYHASHQAARGLRALVAQYGVACHMRPRLSLYLAADDSPNLIQDEYSVRSRADLPSLLLGHAELLQRFAIARAGAILSRDAADADPVLLTRGLLDLSLKRGARLLKANAVAYDGTASSVTVGLEDGFSIEARHVVLATGYVMPDIVRPTAQQPASSWAIATAPQADNLWPGQALIWEATQNYHYARTTFDGRIIFGGEDDHGLIQPDARDAATPTKVRVLKERLTALWPRTSSHVAFTWSGAFDTTRDGLPLIGAVPGSKNIFAAFGYGGNGITFSLLAAELIGSLLSGGSSPLLDDFAFDRDVSG